ncbi:hypothetical protein F8M41_006841 [Gigaspora margarita]|uniref:Uncharacterized protein n=1 Tax=Gigaspora margarita TaxID=4874 RepID=A0A8H4ER83_GIGMA|nr:hypothetical protein F8M41_006841 [Gigaspora margarita]
MIINVSSLNNYLNQNIIPIITDWPGQLFIKKIIIHLKIQQSATNIPQIYKNFHPIIGPLHVALNSKEIALIINYEFFKQLFYFVFGDKKKLAKKPKPWQINLLLELAHKAWQKIKKIISEKFGPYCKDTEYRMAIDLLDNIIPAISDICTVLFRSDNNHPFDETIKSFLVHFNNYYIKNMHSRIRAYTTKDSTKDEIIREAFVIELGYQDTNFKSFHYYLPVLEITVSTKQLPCGYSTKKISLLINCDLCNTLLQNQYEAKVLICGHGYHIICYNAMEERYIDNNEDNENENNNNDNNEVEDLNLVLSEKDKIEQKFTNKLVNVLNW